MLFNSLTFAVFLTAVFILYHIVPARFRWVFLLLASYAFYMNLHAAYGLLLLFSTLLTFLLALRLEKAPDKRKKRLCLAGGILPLVGILLVFKLGAPAIDRLNALIDAGRLSLHPLTLRILLPAGVSFYFFQTMGYLIDVYRGTVPAERHFGHYALFVSFFPQLLAGPIGRADALLPQLKAERRFDYDSAAYGLKLMAWGYFKKLVIADTFAVTVNQVYDNCYSYVGLVFIITTVMYAIQIYCDFSGYSDIAVGCAALFGVKLAANFKSPYLSFSVREFWSRWHISLSGWFRDYVYIPLGGSRTGRIRHCLNLFITFLVSGFWHGSALTFLAWGALHGLMQIAETLLYPKRKTGAPARKKHWWQLPLTFCAVCLAWIFFRANSIQDALWILSRLFWDIGRPLNYLKTAVICLDLSYPAMTGMALSAAVLLLYDAVSLRRDVIGLISRQKAFVRWPVYVLLLMATALFSYKGIATEFIYFQF